MKLTEAQFILSRLLERNRTRSETIFRVLSASETEAITTAIEAIGAYDQARIEVRRAAGRFHHK